jgi:hypothetical protein
MTTAKQELVLMSVACALVGSLAALYVTGLKPNSPYEIVFTAAAAGIVCGPLTWWALITRQQKPGKLRGAGAGCLAVVIGHYLTFVMFSFVQQFTDPTAGPGFSHLGDSLFVSVFIFFPVSLIMVGWFTLPIGTALGIVIVARRRKSPDASVDAAQVQGGNDVKM